MQEVSIYQQVRNAELNLVMFLVTNNLPFLLMDSLPNLLRECCPDSAIAKKLHCARTKSTQLIDTIAQQGRKCVISALQNKKFSLIVDETTDVSSKKCVVLVARYVDNGRVRDRFMALLEVVKADAMSIYNLIKEFFNKHNIPFCNMIGLATDEASVMAEILEDSKLYCRRRQIFSF